MVAPTVVVSVFCKMKKERARLVPSFSDDQWSHLPLTSYLFTYSFACKAPLCGRQPMSKTEGADEGGEDGEDEDGFS